MSHCAPSAHPHGCMCRMFQQHPRCAHRVVPRARCGRASSGTGTFWHARQRQRHAAGGAAPLHRRWWRPPSLMSRPSAGIEMARKALPHAREPAPPAASSRHEAEQLLSAVVHGADDRKRGMPQHQPAVQQLAHRPCALFELRNLGRRHETRRVHGRARRRQRASDRRGRSD
jgi:hypothetical protein